MTYGELKSMLEHFEGLDDTDEIYYETADEQLFCPVSVVHKSKGEHVGSITFQVYTHESQMTMYLGRKNSACEGKNHEFDRINKDIYGDEMVCIHCGKMATVNEAVATLLQDVEKGIDIKDIIKDAVMMDVLKSADDI